MDKKERFERAYNYLKFQGIIKKQEDVAKAMSATRSNVSLALNGNPIVLTDNFLMRFAKAFPGIFNYDWLLSGDGDMLAVNKPQIKQESVDAPNNANMSMYDALLAAKDETICALKQQLATKDEIIQAKDDVIAGLRQQLKSLRSQMEQKELKTELSGYPFPMGAAETERDYKRK